ncbi:MAG: translation initiation factor Sui1 [Proteobacteria bacterium]|nr:translation initiation factor Sui1 [Pseudomonadota bacterium]
MAKRKKDLGTVYSTDQGSMCPQCGNPLSACSCRQNQDVPEGDGIVRLSRETKGRKGKGVTVIRGLPLPPDELKKLAKKLKQKCGTGGSLKDRSIEIQGDHRDVLFEVLTQQGFRVKRSGG